MNTLFFNLSNHPSSKWSEEQRQAAFNCLKIFEQGDTNDEYIVDVPFPNIDPAMDARDVQKLAIDVVDEALSSNIDCETIGVIFHIMGEMTFVYNAVNHCLMDHSIPCCASTTERIVEEKEDGTKVSTFKFVQFRPY